MRSLLVNVFACIGILGAGIGVTMLISRGIDKVDRQLIAARRRFLSSADE